MSDKYVAGLVTQIICQVTGTLPALQRQTKQPICQVTLPALQRICQTQQPICVTSPATFLSDKTTYLSSNITSPYDLNC